MKVNILCFFRPMFLHVMYSNQNVLSKTSLNSKLPLFVSVSMLLILLTMHAGKPNFEVKSCTF